jgi:hypothetical protein
MDLNDFTGLKNFKMDDMNKEVKHQEVLNLDDLLKLPVNKEYQETKDKLKLDINSNFKSYTNIKSNDIVNDDDKR